MLGDVGEGRLVVDWLTQRLTVALCAQQLGTLEGALELTSAYAKTREQFGRPIGTFQAVSQRLADGYIDVLGARLTMWQAAWRLSEGLSAAQEVAVAKLWAADAGHRVAHTTVHVHGGVGIDLDGEAHRYFTAAKRHEFTLGGTTDQSREIGAADGPGSELNGLDDPRDAARAGRRLAPALLSGDDSWTWQEYVAESARRAHVLSGLLDAERPPHVGVLMDNTPETGCSPRCRRSREPRGGRAEHDPAR